MALRSFDLSLNGFSGVDDRITEEHAPGAQVAMVNGCLAGTGLERSAQVRPGIRAPAVGLVSAGRVGQLVTDFVTNIGTRVNVIVYSGEICRSTDGGGNYAVAVSSANFTTAGITVSATRRWYAVALRTRLDITVYDRLRDLFCSFIQFHIIVPEIPCPERGS